MHFPFPALVCDIGGTNVRVARVAAPGAPPEQLCHVRTADYVDLAAVIEALPQKGPILARSLIACGAGPVGGRTIALTNAPWVIDGAQIASRLGLSQGLLLNDFEAQALALPSHRADWLQPIGRVAPQAEGVRLVLGPGTGLGLAGLIRTDGRWLPFASEAGHVDFGPTDSEQERIWPHLERVDGRISAESVCSGPGLVRLHRARLAADGQSAPAMDGVAIVDAGLADPSGPEADTIRLFWRLVARYAGDMALAFLARGGVTLSGGVLPRVAPLVEPSRFRAAFEAKAPMEALLKTIGTQILVAPDAVLPGMAALAADPDAFALDYDARAWVRSGA